MCDHRVLDAFKPKVGQRTIQRLLWAALVLMSTDSNRLTATALAQEVAPLTDVERAAVTKVEEILNRHFKAARTAVDKGDYRSAIKAVEDALAILKAIYGDEHPQLISTLTFLAECHEASANFAAAKLIRMDLVLRVSRAYGLDDYRMADAKLAVKHVATLAALTTKQQKELSEAAAAHRRVVSLYRQGQFAAAAKLGESALESHLRLLGENHPSTAINLNILALLYRAQENHAAAEPLFQRALNIKDKSLGPDHPSTATSLNNLAELYVAQENYAAAKPLYERALKIQEKALGPDHPYTATSLRNLAMLYAAQGSYAAAEPLCQRALKIREKTLGSDNPDTATSLNDLAGMYYSQENYAAAEPLYQRVLRIRGKALGPDHPDTATSINNLAALYHSQGKYDSAEPLYQRALEIYEKSLGPDHPDTASSLNNLAVVYYWQRDYAAAEPVFLRALKIWETSLGPEHRNTALGLNNLAEMYRSQDNYAAAEPLFQRALNIKEKSLGADHPSTATTLYNLAILEWYQGETEVAAPRAQRALEIQLRHLDETAAIQTEQQQFLMAGNVELDVSAWVTVSAPDAKWTDAVYRDVLAWKGSITARQQGLRLALKDDPLFAEFRRVTQQLSTVSLSPPLPPSDPQALAAWKQREPELRRSWESQKATLETAHQRLEQELAVKSVPFRERLEQRRVQPADLVATLKSQSQPIALVDVLEYYYHGRKHLIEKDEQRVVAFVVRGDRPAVRVELGAVDAIAPLVARWRESILRKGHPRDVCQDLRDRVWLPVEAHLDGIETVLISTDGVLGLLPFAALPGRDEGTLLIDEYRLAFVPVPQMIPGLLAKPANSLDHHRLLLVGDVDYGTDATGKHAPWKPLRGTADELAALTRLHGVRFPAADGLLALQGAEATERRVAEQLAQFPVLHFATHGLFQQTEQRVIPQGPARGGTRGPEMLSAGFGDGPQTVVVTRSGLVLAGANRQGEARPEGTGSEVPEDGMLMDNEILAMPLEQASLVVMSACDTAQGKQQSGEGLLGIQRAFQVAGARTTVASLWPVDDAATVLLMQRFYENLWSGKMSKLDSLREAQLWMLQSGKQALRESARRAIARGQEPRGLKLLLDELDEQPGDRLPPFYWAAFELSGDWR